MWNNIEPTITLKFPIVQLIAQITNQNINYEFSEICKGLPEEKAIISRSHQCFKDLMVESFVAVHNMLLKFHNLFAKFTCNFNE